jgi:hypothetical protein
MKKLILITLMLLILVTAFGCIKSDYEYLNEENQDEGTQFFSPAEEEKEPESKETEPQEQEFEPVTDKVKQAPVASPSGKMIIVTEGELVKLNVKGKDLDGDIVTYTYSEPLNENGEWQTEIGDMGNYLVTVTASDGKSTNAKSLPINVLAKNDAPTIEVSDLTVNEGESIDLQPIVKDDSNNFTISYEGWLSTPNYTTTFNDAGTHKVTILANDGTKETRKTITITVNNINRVPTLEDVPDITAKEGETIWVKPKAEDPDKDVLTFTFEAPLDENGKWTTKIGDAGTYKSKATVTDSNAVATTEFQITILPDNVAPSLEPLADVTIKEGQTLTLNPTATDPDGDELTITYGGWITSNTYKTTYTDSGEHVITVTVSDGINIVKQDVKVTVEDVNRAPTFDIIVE